MTTCSWRHGKTFAFAVLLALGGAAPAVAQTEQSAPPSGEPAENVETAQRLTLPRELVVPPAPSWSSLFKDSVTDFRNLPSRDTFTWLSIGAIGALAGHAADRNVTSVLSGSQSLHETLEAGAIIGGMPVQLAASLGAFAIGRATHSNAAAGLGADLFRAQVLAEGTTQALKFAVRRTRPDSTAYSFPSGHTSATFASATVLQNHFGWKIGIPAYAVAAYVAASRVQMQKHYLSDVAFGAALGIVAGRTVTIGRGHARMALSPMAAPGGGGVAFTWLGKKE